VQHFDNAKGLADRDRVFKRGLDFVGRGAGGNVEVLRVAAQQQVAHAPAGQVGIMALRAQGFHHALGQC
jgi:hypothetical protein